MNNKYLAQENMSVGDSIVIDESISNTSPEPKLTLTNWVYTNVTEEKMVSAWYKRYFPHHWGRGHPPLH